MGRGCAATWSELVAHHEQLQSDWDGERCVLCDRTDAEHRADGDRTGKHETSEDTTDCDNEPDCVHGRLGAGVDLFQPARTRQSIVARVGVYDARGRNSTASFRLACVFERCRGHGIRLPDEELRKHVEREHGQSCLVA